MNVKTWKSCSRSCRIRKGGVDATGRHVQYGSETTEMSTCIEL